MSRTKARYTDNPNEPLNPSVEYLTWSPGLPAGAGTLNGVLGGHAYFIFATAACQRVLSGRPVAPRIEWVIGTPATNVFNLVGFRQDGTATFGAYLAGAGFSMAKLSVYSLSGTNSTNATYTSVAGFTGISRATMTRGQACMIACDKVSSFSGPVKVYPAGAAGIVFAADSSRQSLRLRNDNGAPLTVSLTMQRSAPAPSGITPELPNLNYYDFLTGWTNAPRPRLLQAGEEWNLPLAVDRTGMLPGKPYGAVLVCSDTAGGRVEIPLEVAYGQSDPAHALWPAGLWVGKASLDQVSQVLGDGSINDGVKAGGTLDLRLILHVDATNRCRLLQRVIISGSVDSNGNWNAGLYVDEKKAPPGLKSARISSVAFGLKNNDIQWDETYGHFGDKLRFSYVIATNDPVNPFRHPYHPDHDGLSADFHSQLPTGDDQRNYIGEIKPELFSISNTVTLAWTAPPAAGGSSVAWNPSEKVTGKAYFSVVGLRREGPVLMQGEFELQRVSQVGKLSTE